MRIFVELKIERSKYVPNEIDETREVEEMRALAGDMLGQWLT